MNLAFLARKVVDGYEQSLSYPHIRYHLVRGGHGEKLWVLEWKKLAVVVSSCFVSWVYRVFLDVKGGRLLGNCCFEANLTVKFASSITLGHMVGDSDWLRG